LKFISTLFRAHILLTPLTLLATSNSRYFAPKDTLLDIAYRSPQTPYTEPSRWARIIGRRRRRRLPILSYGTVTNVAVASPTPCKRNTVWSTIAATGDAATVDGRHTKSMIQQIYPKPPNVLGSAQHHLAILAQVSCETCRYLFLAVVSLNLWKANIDSSRLNDCL
jgi:hypothetical protein